MLLEDFYAEVLQKMGVLAGEESPSASDRLTVKDKYEQIHAEYSRREIIPWFDDEDVPEWAADSFSTIVGARLCNEFGLPQEKRLELKADATVAITTIIADGQRRKPPKSNAQYY